MKRLVCQRPRLRRQPWTSSKKTCNPFSPGPNTEPLDFRSDQQADHRGSGKPTGQTMYCHRPVSVAAGCHCTLPDSLPYAVTTLMLVVISSNRRRMRLNSVASLGPPFENCSAANAWAIPEACRVGSDARAAECARFMGRIPIPIEHDAPKSGSDFDRISRHVTRCGWHLLGLTSHECRLEASTNRDWRFANGGPPVRPCDALLTGPVQIRNSGCNKRGRNALKRNGASVAARQMQSSPGLAVGVCTRV